MDLARRGRLDGLTFAVAADFPGAIHQGGGKAVCLVDERADEAQRQAIEQLVGGGHGGPWGVFINTYELESPRYVPVEVELDELRSKVRLGDHLELELDTVKNPVTGAESHPRALLPEGLVCKEMSLGASRRFRVNDGVSYDHSGQYAAFAPFHYEGG